MFASDRSLHTYLPGKRTNTTDPNDSLKIELINLGIPLDNLRQSDYSMLMTTTNSRQGDLAMRTIFTGKETVTMPTREDVLNLHVGDLAPSSFGDRRVVEIFACGDNVHGQAYVLYYVEFGDNGSRVSHSLTEDQINRPVNSVHTSAELDWIECQNRGPHAAKSCRVMLLSQPVEHNPVKA
jgi:hypothetical protein